MNLLFVTADQLAYNRCGYAGDPYGATPNIDAFSKESIDFYNCVSSHPVCSAFRASLFTGKYTTSTGMVINEIRMNPAHHPNALPIVLGKNGIRPEMVGKWHLWANRLGDFANIENSFVPPGEYRFGFNGYFAHCNMRHEYTTAFYHLDEKKKIEIEGYEPDVQTDMAIKRLKVAKAENQPLALFVNYGTPHAPWGEYNAPKEELERFQKIDFPLPPNYCAEDDIHNDDWSNECKTPEELKRIMPVYYAMTANLDKNFARLLQALKELDMEEDTIVVFTSDHGEMFGAHGRRNKNIFYDEAARIPFLIRVPKYSAKRSGAPISNVDFMPTLLELLGVPVPADVEGMSVAGLIRGTDNREPEYAFLQNTGPCAIWGDGHEWRAVRDRKFTYAIFRSDGKEELYDNQTDPYQMKNLVQNDGYQEILQQKRRQLAEKMQEINDTFPPNSFYREHWVSEDRIILKTAKNN